MSGPFDIEIVRKLELGGYAAPHHLISDRSIVNAMDGDAVGKQFIAHPFQ